MRMMCAVVSGSAGSLLAEVSKRGLCTGLEGGAFGEVT
jgi:hypothetical protein